MKNKKAVSQYIIVVLSWLGLIAAALFFFVLFFTSMRGCGKSAQLQEISGIETDKSLAQLSLINYVSTPVELKGTKTVSDVLLLSKEEFCSGSFLGDSEVHLDCIKFKEKNRDYYSEIAIKKAKEAFDPVFGEKLWYLEIGHPEFKDKSESGIAIIPFKQNQNFDYKCRSEFGGRSLRVMTVNQPVKERTIVNTTIPDKENQKMIVKLAFCKIE